MLRLKRVFDQSVKRAQERGRLYGRIGQGDGTGRFTLYDPDELGRVLLTLNDGTITHAFNYGAQLTAGLDVEIEERRGQLVIIAPDPLMAQECLATTQAIRVCQVQPPIRTKSAADLTILYPPGGLKR